MPSTVAESRAVISTVWFDTAHIHFDLEAQWQSTLPIWTVYVSPARYFCIQFTLCWTATALEGLLEKYHSSSAALSRQHPEVTKQQLVCDWSVTAEMLVVLIVASLNIRRPPGTLVCAGVKKWQLKRALARLTPALSSLQPSKCSGHPL